jgi:hypothetical protein
MELLIVLGLCFGAYELLGVFQGCFHNEPPLPYQPPFNKRNSGGGGNNNSQGDETKEDDGNDDEQLSEKKNFNVDSREYRRIDKENKLKSIIQARSTISKRVENEDGGINEEETEDDEEEAEEEEESPCSCGCNTATELDDYDNDDTRIILKNKKKTISRKNHPISKFSLSSSLMSLNRDDLTLFNFFDDSINSSCTTKFSKFRSEAEICETSFNNKFSSFKSCNEKERKKSSCSLASRIEESATFGGETHHNEDIAEANSPTVNSKRKKIFFISAAS